MKKALTVVLILALALCSVFAGDFKFLFTELDQHPEILAGFLPTLTAIGAGYEGLSLIEGDLTQFQATIGGGYTQRVLFQDPVTGEPLISDQMLYDQIQVRWNLKFLQGFGDSWVEGKDLVTAYVGYEGRYEKAIDSMKVHEARFRGYADPVAREKGKTAIPSLDEWFNTHYDDGSGNGTLKGNKIYPDLADDYSAFMTNFYLGARLNLMEDKMVSNQGGLAEIKLQFAPSFLNNKASYYSVTFNAVAGTTLFEMSNKKGLNLFSVVLIDRVNVNWTDGSQVPVYASRPVSLGRKVRGFNTNSYNTNFTVVNNLDIRLAGPEFLLDGVFPRLNLFFDMGWHAGNYLNTGHNGVAAASAGAMAEKYDLKRFLCSTGFQLEMCIYDFIDLGFQLSYLISGDNMKTPGEKFITGATFFLDF
ncbi:MAG: hypothetical protein IKO96_01170 [Spirochaetales bacterium]|nr:hypothetical protein [Spirochaetales bacterium]